MSTHLPSPQRSFWQNLFLSLDEPRLRAGWRLAIQTALFLLIMIVLSVPAVIAVLILRGSTTGTGFDVLSSVIELVGVTVSVFVARRFLDRRSFVSLGFKLEWRVLLDLLTGIAITFAMMGLIYLALSSMGWLHFDGFAWQQVSLPAVIGNFLLAVLLFVMVAWNEELLSRGYELQTLASGINLFWGVVLSSIVFGLLHLANPNATWLSAVGIFFAGLFLAYAYLRTGQLWLSIGLHFGWNLFEGPVFGFPVSGLGVFHITNITVSGPTLWTGGAFGPEAGLIILPAIAIGAALIHLYSRLRRRSA
jgi:membrane protease YdiL (CAAX protease family)